MNPVKIRAWWVHRQGLDGSLAGKPASEALVRAGWARSVGGCGPYLTLQARTGMTREAVDAAVARAEIHELPSARGCTYVLPAADFALGLTVAQGFNTDFKTAEKLGVTAKEVDKLCAKVVAALENAPLDPDALRDAVGSAVRNLGEEGKKKGLATTLPLALGRLQTDGEIRRIPTNGRLDQQRYKYTLWRPNPLAQFKLSAGEVFTELARRYFTWIGPATLAEFQWFSGLGLKAAKAAVEPLKLEPLAAGDPRLLLAGDREKLESFKPPKGPQYALVSGLDSIVLLRRDHKSLLDPQDLDHRVFSGKGVNSIGGLSDLPSHALLDRGRLIGLWEFDPASNAIAWISFVKKTKLLVEAVARTEAYVRDQLGDARLFSLDSPASRAPKIAALRAAAGG
jgi:hypothetical protein